MHLRRYVRDANLMARKWSPIFFNVSVPNFIEAVVMETGFLHTHADHT